MPRGRKFDQARSEWESTLTGAIAGGGGESADVSNSLVGCDNGHQRQGAKHGREHQWMQVGQQQPNAGQDDSLWALEPANFAL